MLKFPVIAGFSYITSIKLIAKKEVRGFPGGAVVKNPPANTGDPGSKPWSRKIPHATEQLSLCATTTEPSCHNY